MAAAEVLELDGAIREAVIFVSRLALRPIISRDLKAAGIETVQTVESTVDCISAILHRPHCLLVIDWEQGEEEVIKVLKAAQGEFGVDTRPIYLIAFQSSQRLISVAHEYNVAQIHSGEISKAQIEKNLKELTQFSLLSELCRETFAKVAKARKAGDNKTVLNLLSTLTKAEPDNMRAAVEYGYSLCEEGGLGAAIEHLVGVTNRFPFELRAKHLLARCYMKLGEWDKAQSYLEQAELIDPKNVDRLCDYGRALMNTDQIKKAMGKFNKALELDADCSEAKMGRIQCDLLLDHMNDALKMLNQMQGAQELASVFNGAAIIAIRKKNFKQGLSLYKTAVSYVSGDSSVLARVFFNMGLGLVKWGKIPLAVAAFEKASKLDPTFAKARHNAKLIEALNRKGVDVHNLRYAKGEDKKAEGNAIGSLDEPFADDDEFLDNLVPME